MTQTNPRGLPIGLSSLVTHQFQEQIPSLNSGHRHPLKGIEESSHHLSQYLTTPRLDLQLMTDDI